MVFAARFKISRRYAAGTQQYFQQLRVTVRPNAVSCGFVAQPSKLAYANAESDGLKIRSPCQDAKIRIDDSHLLCDVRVDEAQP